MAAVKPNLSRLYNLQVSIAGSVFTTVSGVQNLSVTRDTTMVDITTFDTEGLNVEMPASFAGTVDFELISTVDTSATPYVQDAGQAIILSAATDLGLASRIHFKITHKDTTNYTGDLTGTGYVSIDKDSGGGNGDVDMIVGRIRYDDRPTGTGWFANKMGDT